MNAETRLLVVLLMTPVVFGLVFATITGMWLPATFLVAAYLVAFGVTFYLNLGEAVVNVGDSVQLRVAEDMGTWDIPVGKVGMIVGFKGPSPIITFDPPLYGSDSPVTVEVHPSHVMPAPRAQSRRKS